MLVDFWVPGDPQPKGSHRGFVVGGRAVVTNASPKTRSWEFVVGTAARLAMGNVAPMTEALMVTMVFYMRRPVCHFAKRGYVSPSAPKLPTSRPDVDKLVRCALDPLTGIVFGDDSKVILVHACKLYASTREPGVRIRVEEFDVEAHQVPGLSETEA